MDPLMKFLEEDEDETVHSGADVDAFTAELNRDIEGNNSPSVQPSETDAGAVASQGSGQTTGHFLSDWQTSSHDGIVNFQSGLDNVAHVGTNQHSQMESQKDDLQSENRKQDGLPSPHDLSVDTSTQLPDEQNNLPLSQPSDGIQSSGEQLIDMPEMNSIRNLENESQTHMLQNIGSAPSMLGVGLNDQQSFSAGEMTQQTSSMGISSMPMANQLAVGVGMGSSQPAMTTNNQKPGTTSSMQRQVPFGMLLPIIQPQLDKDRAMQLTTLYLKLKKCEISKDGFVRHMRSIVGDQMLKMAVYKLQTQKMPQNVARDSSHSSSQFPSPMQILSSAKVPTDDGLTSKSSILESQHDSSVVQGSQMPTSSSVALSQDRRHPVFSAPGVNKQQFTHLTPASFTQFGAAGSGQLPYDSQMRATSHPSMTVNSLGPATQTTNMMTMSKFERSHTDTKKVHGVSLAQTNSNLTVQQNQVQWPTPSKKDAKVGVPTSMNHVKQEPLDQSSGAFDVQSSRVSLMPAASMVGTSSVPSSVPSRMDTNILSNSRMPSLSTPVGPGNSSKSTPKKVMVGQKKPMEPPGSSPPSSKKQKVSGGFSDQSIEHLNDVTAVSGVNLREEEEQLFSGSKEDVRVSEASRRVVQEEEERLILQKVPLQKKLVEILAKFGLKNMGNDVERCLSLCVEERLRSLISNSMRFSKQRVDIENPRHKMIVTSDVRQQIQMINRKAREEWEKNQAETDKSHNSNEESTSGVDGDKEKDENRSRIAKANKEEDDKMRATAANVAVRAATGGGDMLSRWQLMIEAKQKQSGAETPPSATQTGKDIARKQSSSSTRNKKDSNQESERRDHHSAAVSNTSSVRKVGRNQVFVPRVARSTSVKDLIAVLEREPQMSKSTLLYRLYNKVSADDAALVE